MNRGGGTRTRGASFVEAMVLVAFAVGVVLAAAKLLGSQADETSDSLGEHIKTMTETQSRTSGTGSGANGGDTYAATNATCDSTHGCEAAAPSPAPSPPPAPAPAPPAEPESRGFWGNVGSFGKGFFVDGVWGTVVGVGTMVAHPIDTAKGIGNAIAHPIDTATGAWDGITKAWDEDPARVLGGGLFQVVTIVGPGAIAKVGTVAKVGDVAAEASAAGKVANAARTAKAAETTASATSKAGEICESGVCRAIGNCFAAGTPVLTATGERPIEDVAVGDLVLSRDPATGETLEERVVELFVTPDRAVVDLALVAEGAAPEHITVTAEHPFFEEGRGFVPVKDLAIGAHVETASGIATVISLASIATPRTVYNFEVEDAHTYFVGHLAAWVHNICAADLEKQISKMTPGDRVAAVRTAVGDYAAKQGWVKDSKLSKINGRDVYRDPKTGNLYSTDTQHGRIETANKRGKHQGEMDIDGKATKPADPSGGHDLNMG